MAALADADAIDQAHRRPAEGIGTRAGGVPFAGQEPLRRRGLTTMAGRRSTPNRAVRTRDASRRRPAARWHAQCVIGADASNMDE